MSFLDGKKRGEDIKHSSEELGFDSEEENVAHQLGVISQHESDLLDLYRLNPTYAKEHAEFLEGLKAGLKNEN